MVFVPLSGGPGLEHVQIFARSEINDEARSVLREIPENSAISVTGILGRKYEAKGPKKERVTEEGYCSIDEVEIRAQSVTCLSSFPKGLKEHSNQQYEPKYRHLQIRFDDQLRERLKFRSKVAAFARNELSDFQEVETPILFKSTPEGAREFIVPTRRRGYAYGLPQSPQQYKQILMASGIQRYIQFAKCFRDEDHRADRQPEFTQVSNLPLWLAASTYILTD
jgi:aspartyl-tRNA synthetase